MKLWYNHKNVIALELESEPPPAYIRDALVWEYESLEEYGTYHFIAKYELSRKHLKLLGEYFNYQSQNVKII
jgi:hypothetical protein